MQLLQAGLFSKNPTAALMSINQHTTMLPGGSTPCPSHSDWNLLKI